MIGLRLTNGDYKSDQRHNENAFRQLTGHDKLRKPTFATFDIDRDTNLSQEIVTQETADDWNADEVDGIINLDVSLLEILPYLKIVYLRL